MRLVSAGVQVALLSAALCSTGRALALDKQGSAHGGDIEGAKEGFGVSGSAALGISPYNPTFAARPDNSGKALLRFGLDGTLFTDRTTNAVRPSELDLTPEIIGRYDPFELHLAYEFDTPTDGRGTRPVRLRARGLGIRRHSPRDGGARPSDDRAARGRPLPRTPECPLIFH